MRRRLRYFRLFGLTTVIFVIVGAAYLAVRPRPEPGAISPSKPQPTVAQRVVAAMDLMPRTLITPAAVQVEEVPTTAPLPLGAFTDTQQVLYRLTKTLIRKGEPIFEQHVTPPLSENGRIAWLIPPGKLGMVLVIPHRDSVPPVRTGDYISIHAVFMGLKAKTIVPQAMVLAVDNRVGEISLTPQPAQSAQEQPSTQPTQPAQGQPSPLNLLVALSPQETKAVALAMDSGATLYYTIYGEPMLPPPPNMEKDLTLRDLVGPALEPIIAKSRNIELKSEPTPTPPPDVYPSQPFTPSLAQELPKPVQQVERPTVTPPTPPSRRVVGVIGDQLVTITVPSNRNREGVRR